MLRTSRAAAKPRRGLDPRPVAARRAGLDGAFDGALDGAKLDRSTVLELPLGAGEPRVGSHPSLVDGVIGEAADPRRSPGDRRHVRRSA
ncbi:MAG: hypothetical protein KF729_25090, partial [Sandaracinaceae bacterium]|nr:hypothetical protein [Sandaracinaceae bacterium]